MNITSTKQPIKGLIFFLRFSLLFCYILLSSCTPQTKNTVSDDKCIGSFDTLAYDIPDKNKPLQDTVLPLSPWQIEAQLPQIFNEPVKKYHVEITRFIEGHNEIWIMNRDELSINSEKDISTIRFMIYRTDSQIWDFVPAQVDGTEIYVGKLFVTNDGSIWGQNYRNKPSNNVPDRLLSKYNEATKKFEIQNEIPVMPIYRDGWTEILLDKKDVFWIFINLDSIYSFDVTTKKLEKKAMIPDIIVHNVVVDSDSNLYIRNINVPIKFSFAENEIFRYSPSTGEINPITPPNGYWPAFRKILIDKNDRLWLSAIGWREKYGSWHRIHKRPWLHWWKMNWEADYRWKGLAIKMESSNGYIWFGSTWDTGDRGMVWLDPKTNESCWFTTIDTSIIEDQEQILWLAAGGNLYKYSLGTN